MTERSIAFHRMIWCGTMTDTMCSDGLNGTVK